MGIAERREREKQMRHQQIMHAAKKIFAEKGFAGATMESIAEEAEYSPATIYLYFKNKDELYASLMLEMLQVLVDQMEAVADQKDLSPDNKIKALEKALYDVYEYDPVNVINVLRFQSSEALRALSPEIVAQIKDSARKYLRAIAGIFQDGVRKGVFVDRHPIAFADIVWSLFTGVVLWEASKRGFDPRKDFLRPTLGLAIEIISRGIKKNHC
jgi:AcrR family transcriptional regulator